MSQVELICVCVSVVCISSSFGLAQKANANAKGEHITLARSYRPCSEKRFGGKRFALKHCFVLFFEKLQKGLDLTI